MSQLLKINNYSSNNILATTQLANDVAVNDATLKVQSSADAAANGFAIIGILGTSDSEMVTINSAPIAKR
jgi:hypothetical protein